MSLRGSDSHSSASQCGDHSINATASAAAVGVSGASSTSTVGGRKSNFLRVHALVFLTPCQPVVKWGTGGTRSSVVVDGAPFVIIAGSGSLSSLVGGGAPILRGMSRPVVCALWSANIVASSVF